LGSSTDSGNLLQVLKLNEAQVTGDSAVGTSGVGGISDTLPLSGGTDAGFQTPVTSGYFTINGVQIQVSNTGDNVNSILQKINASAAGVTATYDANTNQITLTNSSTGAESIVVGAAGDTSNFLSAAGLTSASGATTVVGQQASVTLQTASGGEQTIYSNSNSITDAIPGISLNITSDVGPTGNPYTITVSQNTAGLVSAIGNFQTAYNAAITEINAATAPPVVTSAQIGTLNAANSTSALGAGVLYGRADISQLKDDLTNIVSGFLGDQTRFDSSAYTGASGSYNSLSSIGLSLNDSFSELTSANNTGQNQNSSTSSTSSLDSASTPNVQTTTLEGTDGTLAALNVSQFLTAYQTDPTAVQNLLQGASGLTSLLGSDLTSATGTPTLLDSGPVGAIPTTSFMTGFEDQVNDQIASLQDQVAQITDNANSQANLLRAQFVASDTLIGEYSSLQSELSGFFSSSNSG
jgi:flagellar capping protein FliD